MPGFPGVVLIPLGRLPTSPIPLLARVALWFHHPHLRAGHVHARRKSESIEAVAIARQACGYAQRCGNNSSGIQERCRGLGGGVCSFIANSHGESSWGVDRVGRLHSRLAAPATEAEPPQDVLGTNCPQGRPHRIVEREADAGPAGDLPLRTFPVIDHRGHALSEVRRIRSPRTTSLTPDFSDYPLDAGIRPEFNTCSGDPGEVAEGEVNAHPGNPGSGCSAVTTGT